MFPLNVFTNLEDMVDRIKAEEFSSSKQLTQKVEEAITAQQEAEAKNAQLTNKLQELEAELDFYRQVPVLFSPCLFSCIFLKLFSAFLGRKRTRRSAAPAGNVLDRRAASTPAASPAHDGWDATSWRSTAASTASRALWRTSTSSTTTGNGRRSAPTSAPRRPSSTGRAPAAHRRIAFRHGGEKEVRRPCGTPGKPIGIRWVTERRRIG